MIDVTVTVRTVQKVTIDEGHPAKARGMLAKAVADASGAKAKEFERDLRVPVGGETHRGSVQSEDYEEVTFEFTADPDTQREGA